MVSAHQRADGRVARQFLGYFIEDEYKEIVQIEYRYTPGGGFDLCTHIRGRDYRITEHKFFSAMAELLDRLPLTSTLVISHQIVMAYPDSAEEKATLEEWLFPFGGEKPTGTVVYQLKLLAGGRRIETSRYTSSGSFVTGFAIVLTSGYTPGQAILCQASQEVVDESSPERPTPPSLGGGTGPA